MLNKKPIFINAFSRGGSNLVWNVFLTHPDVCSPILETLEIFRIGVAGRREGYEAVWQTRQIGFFNQRKLAARRPISAQARTFIDATLHQWKLKTATDIDMKYKSEDQTYTIDEVVAARLVAKNNNGLTFLSDRLVEMYPDATFVGLVRNPLALYESFNRVKFIRSVDEFVNFYNRMVGKMIKDSKRYERYCIIRFEDMVANPMPTIWQLYDFAGLDREKVQKIRFKAKRHYTADGTRDSALEVGRHFWFSFDEVPGFLDEDINTYHIQQLPEAVRDDILTRTEATAGKLGYGQP
jgi:hypothetical protein